MSKKTDVEIVNRAIGGGETKKHECDTLANAKVNISVETINGKWYWIFWDSNPVEAHGILFCPYCGEKLDKEV